ncbi:ParA family protein [Gilliamella sp. BG6]|uniref:ParA family protein n=1 Tax=unclassified Gilliamella TaxID=2685620 RepID=UPI0039884105
MGSIILFDSVKGGVGKSTLLAQFSVALGSKFNIAIMDCDPQKSVENWAIRRLSSEKYEKNFSLLEANLKYLEKLQQEFDFILVDSAGADTETGRELLLLANIVISPLQPTQASLDTVSIHYEILEQAMNLNPAIKAFYLLNDCSTHFKDNETYEAEKELKEFLALNKNRARIVHNYIYSRKLLKTSYSDGGTCFDMGKNKSKDEIKNAINFIFSE